MLIFSSSGHQGGLKIMGGVEKTFLLFELDEILNLS